MQSSSWVISQIRGLEWNIVRTSPGFVDEAVGGGIDVEVVEEGVGVN